MKKIIWKKTHLLSSCSAGMIEDATDAYALEMIAQGYAELVDENKKETATEKKRTEKAVEK